MLTHTYTYACVHSRTHARKTHIGHTQDTHTDSASRQTLTQYAHVRLVGRDHTRGRSMRLQAGQMVVWHSRRSGVWVIEAVLAAVALQPEAESLIVPAQAQVTGNRRALTRCVRPGYSWGAWVRMSVRACVSVWTALAVVELLTVAAGLIVLVGTAHKRVRACLLLMYRLCFVLVHVLHWHYTHSQTTHSSITACKVVQGGMG